ncbi:MAG: molybdopterin molybdotransferase MoeA [Hyphomicrobiaceae bacterium]
MTHDEVIGHLRAHVQPTVNHVQLPLSQAAGRISAEDICANEDVPGHTNAAVDGFAIRFSELSETSAAELTICGRAAAGRPYLGEVPQSSAVRIFTGAALPRDVDTVAMQEDCSVIAAQGATPSVAYGTVRIPPGLKRGANVRLAGEDLGRGDKLVSDGHLLRPQDLAALASIGRDNVRCYKSVAVAVVSTGDEVIRAGTSALSYGQVFDANAPMLMSLICLSGGAAHDLGVWPDRPSLIEDKLAEAAASYNLILTSGGASMGEEDHLAKALDRLGHRHFWQIAVKPGRPLMLGQIGNSVVIGLPGNPVAVFVCYLMYVRPLLRRLGGGTWPEPRRFPLRANFKVPGRKVGRREFWRARTVATSDGLKVEKFEKDGSGLISGLRAADGLIDVREDVASVEEGQTVEFIPMTEFGISV